MIDFSQKKVVITGGSSGIGLAAAQLISSLGGKVYIIGRDKNKLHTALSSLVGNGHSAFSHDLRNLDDIPSLLIRISEEHGKLDGLFHAAGVTQVSSIQTLKRTQIDEIFTSSIFAGLFLAKGFSNHKVRSANGGSIVFMSSILSAAGTSGVSIYSASKSALDGATRSLACELATKNVRVNTILAGTVKTNMTDQVSERLPHQSLLNLKDKHLLGLGDAQDIAMAAAFLLSDASKWITGTSLVVDGGYLCQ